jgi:hypothetical protein
VLARKTNEMMKDWLVRRFCDRRCAQHRTALQIRAALQEKFGSPDVTWPGARWATWDDVPPWCPRPGCGTLLQRLSTSAVCLNGHEGYVAQGLSNAVRLGQALAAASPRPLTTPARV